MKQKAILLATAGSLFLAGTAFAQDSSDDNAGGGLEEIVVTAQKRAENLQDVPISVTALGAEAIANQRIVDFADLTRAAPSLTMTQTNSSSSNSVSLRGIGTFAFSIGVEPSVAIIIDDMPVVQQGQAFDNLSDLARIEVLKGPQGTLFGKNASAGVINIVTADPDGEFSGKVSGTAATDGDVRVEGVLSLPISDGAGLRLTGFYHNFPGNVRNLTTSTRLNDQENYGIRAKFKANLSDALTFTLTGAYSKAVQDGTGSTLLGIYGTGTPRVIGQIPYIPSLVGITPGPDNYRARLDTPGATLTKTASVAGKLDLDLGFANLISITAFQDWKHRFEFDVDGSDTNILAVLTGGAFAGGIAQGGPFHSTNLTQELRLVSSGNGPLKYVVGGFYSDANTDRAFVRRIFSPADWTANNKTKSLGLFAQVDYTFPSDTTISGGIRYNHEKISVVFDNLVPTATPNTCAAGNPLCRGTNSESVITWKGAVSQKLAQDIMVFASVARGHKGFAYDISSGFNPARIDGRLGGTGPGLTGAGPAKPEKSTSYEVGFKSRFLDNRVQLNVVGFYTDYNNFQAQSAVFVGTPPVLQVALTNVGQLRTKGVEMELQAKPVDWLRFDAGAAYTDAVTKTFVNAPGYTGQVGQIYDAVSRTSALVGRCTTAPVATAAAPRTLCTLQDRSGGRLSNSPKFKWNLSATAEFGLMSDAKGIFIVNYQHQSGVNFDLLGNPLLVQRAYGVLNASLGVEFANIRATVFVNNLFDEHYAASMADGFGSMGGSAANDTHPVTRFLTRDSQRYGGMKLTVSF